METVRISGHSTRIGAAQEMGRYGIQLPTIMQAAGSEQWWPVIGRASTQTGLAPPLAATKLSGRSDRASLYR